MTNTSWFRQFQNVSILFCRHLYTLCILNAIITLIGLNWYKLYNIGDYYNHTLASGKDRETWLEGNCLNSYLRALFQSLSEASVCLFFSQIV